MNNKIILCAIDFSSSSLQALEWTMKTAGMVQSQVTVLFCYRLIATGNDEATLHLKKSIEDEACRKFHEIESKMVHGKNVPYQFVTEVGFFPSRIEMYVRKSPVNLLVLGNSIIESFNEFKNLSFERFLRNSKVPVVIVPGDLCEIITLK